mmetsp:Transcript_55585/g.161042  ORF Transcript_55585/g.161042 Transcript_55585/m.161042 type:complete len:113 (-) Transcript_55585:111-449(-)
MRRVEQQRVRPRAAGSHARPQPCGASPRQGRSSDGEYEKREDSAKHSSAIATAAAVSDRQRGLRSRGSGGGAGGRLEHGVDNTIRRCEVKDLQRSTSTTPRPLRQFQGLLKS